MYNSEVKCCPFIVSIIACSAYSNTHLIRTIFFFQLKSLFEIFTFVSKRNIKYQYLILALLILVTCHRNSVSRFSTIQLRVINKFNTDFESYFMSGSNSN